MFTKKNFNDRVDALGRSIVCKKCGTEKLGCTGPFCDKCWPIERKKSEIWKTTITLTILILMATILCQGVVWLWNLMKHLIGLMILI